MRKDCTNCENSTSPVSCSKKYSALHKLSICLGDEICSNWKEVPVVDAQTSKVRNQGLESDRCKDCAYKFGSPECEDSQKKFEYQCGLNRHSEGENVTVTK